MTEIHLDEDDQLRIQALLLKIAVAQKDLEILRLRLEKKYRVPEDALFRLDATGTKLVSGEEQ